MAIDGEKFKIEPDEDDNIDVLTLAKHLEEDTERKKKQASLEFEELGGKYIKEIETKKKKKSTKQAKLIPYILKHREDEFDEAELMSYSYEDVVNIYNNTKKENRPAVLKFILFIFNIE